MFIVECILSLKLQITHFQTYELIYMYFTLCCVVKNSLLKFGKTSYMHLVYVSGLSYASETCSILGVMLPQIIKVRKFGSSYTCRNDHCRLSFVDFIMPVFTSNVN
jgi:hypothetical protein